MTLDKMSFGWMPVYETARCRLFNFNNCFLGIVGSIIRRQIHGTNLIKLFDGVTDSRKNKLECLSFSLVKYCSVKLGAYPDEYFSDATWVGSGLTHKYLTTVASIPWSKQSSLLGHSICYCKSKLTCVSVESFFNDERKNKLECLSQASH
jgi:hypothetical protein